MLAVVKTPRTEIALHGDGADAVLAWLRRKFTVEIVPVHHVSEVIDEVLPALNRTETPSGPAR